MEQQRLIVPGSRLSLGERPAARRVGRAQGRPRPAGRRPRPRPSSAASTSWSKLRSAAAFGRPRASAPHRRRPPARAVVADGGRRWRHSLLDLLDVSALSPAPSRLSASRSRATASPPRPVKRSTRASRIVARACPRPASRASLTAARKCPVAVERPAERLRPSQRELELEALGVVARRGQRACEEARGHLRCAAGPGLGRRGPQALVRPALVDRRCEHEMRGDPVRLGAGRVQPAGRLRVHGRARRRRRVLVEDGADHGVREAQGVRAVEDPRAGQRGRRRDRRVRVEAGGARRRQPAPRPQYGRRRGRARPPRAPGRRAAAGSSPPPSAATAARAARRQWRPARSGRPAPRAAARGRGTGCRRWRDGTRPRTLRRRLPPAPPRCRPRPARSGAGRTTRAVGSISSGRTPSASGRLATTSSTASVSRRVARLTDEAQRRLVRPLRVVHAHQQRRVLGEGWPRASSRPWRRRKRSSSSWPEASGSNSDRAIAAAPVNQRSRCASSAA